MAEIFGSAVASESVSRIFSILSLPGNKGEHESAEDNAERLEFAVLKIHSVISVSEDWLILHQPLIGWRSRLKRVAKEGDDILRALRRRSTEERGRNEGAAARQNASVRKRITRAATRFLPFRRRGKEEEDGPSEATVRRFERLATVADEFFRYVRFGGRPRSVMTVSFRIPMEPLLAGRTLEFSLRMGSRDAILVLHPCDGGEAGRPREIALFLSCDDTAAWRKNVKLFVVFRLLDEDVDVLDTVMSALQLLPPQFGAACVTTRELIREVLPTLETSYSSASSVSLRCVSTAWNCHRNSMDRGCDAAGSSRPRLPLPIIRVDAVYFTDTMPQQKGSSDIPATAGGLPLRLACHITPHLMPQVYSEQYEQIGEETLQELELLPQVTDEGTPACMGNWWCPGTSTFLSVEPEPSVPPPKLEQLFLIENSCTAEFSQ